MADSVESSELIEFVRRSNAFRAFADARLDKRALADELSISPPTAYRIISSFEDADIIQRVDGKYELTSYGSVLGDAVETYEANVKTATALKPILNELPDCIEFDHRLFADATVTNATYDDPFKPMNRFIELFSQADRIKGFNRSFLEPMYIELAIEKLDAGMESEIIYDPNVIDLILQEYPDVATMALEAENMRAYTYDELPLALVVLEDRIGIGAHSESMGTPVSWIDTDDPDAIAWGERLFEKYRNKATRLY